VTIPQGESAYEGWALVEQMGFRKTYCRVREVEQFGTKMLRMDVPIPGQPDGWVTFFAGGPSLYQVTPLTEELARAFAERAADPRPVMPVSWRLTDERDKSSGEHEPDFDDNPYNGDDDGR
jgi:hypothetical protein